MWAFFKGLRSFRGPQKQGRKNDHNSNIFWAKIKMKSNFIREKLNGIFVVFMKFWKAWFFFQLPIKKVGFITLILSQFQILKAKLTFSDFWGPLNLLGPLKKSQLLDSWPLSMPLKTRPWMNLFKFFVLYLIH